MIARITPYRIRPDTIGAATDLMDTLKDRIMGLRGIRQCVCTVNADGAGYVVALVDSLDDVKANEPEAEKIWAGFADFLVEPPSPADYDVSANWTN